MGRWDSNIEVESISDILRELKILNAADLIDQLAMDGIEVNKLPEHFVLGERAKKVLIGIVEGKIDRMEGLPSLMDAIMGFLKGYAEGLEEAIVDKKVTENL